MFDIDLGYSLISGNQEVRVELLIGRSDCEENEWMFDQMEEQKEAFPQEAPT